MAKRRAAKIQEPELTSDSENDITDDDMSTKEKMLGEISLLTSDEEEEPIKVKKKNKPKKIQTIDLLTSDEDDINVNSQPIETKNNTSTLNTEVNISLKSKTASTSTAQRKRKSSGTPLPAKRKRKSLDSSPSSEVSPEWEDAELLAEKTQTPEEIAKNLIKLWEEGNTIPFIARYRKNMIGNMTPEALRTVKESYDEISALKKKMCTVVKTVKQLGKLDNRLQGNICAARTIEELDHIFFPFKPESKGSLADRARKCGLEEPALHLLNNTSMVNPKEFVNTSVKEVQTTEDVEKGLVHILAAEMSVDPELLIFLRDLRSKTRFRLQTKKARQINKTEKKTLTEKAGQKKDSHAKDPALEEAKFEMYFDYIQRIDYLKSHQVLAINRGESLKILSVKIEIPEFFEKQIKYFCTKKWTNLSTYDVYRQNTINAAIDDMYQRIIIPLVTREIRAALKLKAEKESCKIFSGNLKHLLLAAPMKGKLILGIDPGFRNGCKLALISSTGSLLDHNVVFPHTSYNNQSDQVVKDLLMKYKCNLIAIGNGTACRQTEKWISDLIRTNYFSPLDVKYIIISEDGASIYSCSPEAQKEFGALDPNIISAVSLARRVQDPMAELVKVEPCHLGIGMYQLDIKKKHLEEALSEVVSECVSFVGVDLNTASQCLLRRVAGLSDKKATQIIDYREKNGPFTYRRELLSVFGIGERVFEQCAGFLRVGPTDPCDFDFYSKPSTTPLDATIIHPESYPMVNKILSKMGLAVKDIGSTQFIDAFQSRASTMDIDKLSVDFKTDKPTILLIFDALSKTLNHDQRTEVSSTPLFKKNVISINTLETGDVLTGRVKNVTSFGAFVDIGVERDGLVHNKFMNNLNVHLGNVLEVKVIKVDLIKKHIQLEASRIIS